MKKLRDLAHEKIVNKISGHCLAINIQGHQPYPVNCHLCPEISKQWTVLHTTVTTTRKEKKKKRGQNFIIVITLKKVAGCQAGVLYFFNWNDFGDTNPAGSYEKVFWLLAKIISPDPKGWQTATFNKDLLLLSASSRTSGLSNIKVSTVELHNMV